MAGNDKNQGEGDIIAARRYRKDVRSFVERREVEAASERAKHAVEGGEAEALEKAEKAGKAGPKAKERKADKR